MKKAFVLYTLFILLLSACQPGGGAVVQSIATEPALAADATQPVEATQPVDATAVEPSSETEVTDPPAADADPSVVTRALTSEPPSLDPHGPAGSGQNVILPFLFDTLVYRDFDNEYRPYLATDWEFSDDGTTVTMNLRDDVVFHDGTPFNADAVLFNIDRLRQAGPRSPASNGVAEITEVEKVDDYSVVFHFDQPSAVLLSTLSTPYAAMISPTAAQAQGDTFGQNPVGSGPYMLESWIPGQEIHLTVNPDYSWAPPVVENQGRPDIDRLVFKIIPDPTAQVNAFQNDEVDILFINNPGHLAQLRQDENAVLLENTLNSLIYLGFNMNEPALQNLQVRQALSHAVNKQEIVDIALGGIGEVVFAPLVPTLPGFDPSLADYELGYEPQMAQQLLEEAGYVMGPGDLYTSPDGQPLTLTLLTSTRPPNEAIATVLQSQLKAVGVEVQIQQLESTAVMEAAANGEYDLLLWRYDWNDADVLNVYLGSDRIGSTNRQFYQNEQVDELLNLGAHTLDETERQQYYLQAQQLILQDAVWQPLYTPLDYTVVRSTLDNVVLGPMGRLLLNDAHWEGN